MTPNALTFNTWESLLILLGTAAIVRRNNWEHVSGTGGDDRGRINGQLSSPRNFVWF